MSYSCQPTDVDTLLQWNGTDIDHLPLIIDDGERVGYAISQSELQSHSYAIVYSDTILNHEASTLATCYIYVDGKRVGELRRCDYRSAGLMEWVEHPRTHNVYLLFCAEHGSLGVYDPTGHLIHTDKWDDRFLTSIVWLPGNLFLLHYWIWQPVYATDVYDLESLLDTPNYTGYCLRFDMDDSIWKEAEENSFLRRGEWVVRHPHVPWGEVVSLKEAVKRGKEIEQHQYHTYVCSKLIEPNVLTKLTSDYPHIEVTGDPEAFWNAVRRGPIDHVKYYGGISGTEWPDYLIKILNFPIDEHFFINFVRMIVPDYVRLPDRYQIHQLLDVYTTPTSGVRLRLKFEVCKGFDLGHLQLDDRLAVSYETL